MKCYYHRDREAVAVCSVCKKPLCKECTHEVNGKIYCVDCLRKLTSEKESMEKSPLIVAVVAIVTAAILLTMSFFSGRRLTLPFLPESSSASLTASMKPLGNETSLNVIIEFGALDTLSIKTTSTLLYSFDYPDLADLTTSYANGTLTLKQKDVPSIFLPFLTKRASTLELYVSDKIPVNLNIKLGAGEIEIQGIHLTLDTTKIELGAGEIKVSGGDMEDLTIKLGTGEVNIDSVSKSKGIYIQNGVGEVSLDLSALESQCNVKARSGLGEISIRVPDDIGVKASIKSLEVSQSGFNKVNDTYVNDAYSTKGAQISIDVSCGLGSVKLNEE